METVNNFTEYGNNGEIITFGIVESGMFVCQIKYPDGDITSATRKCMAEIHKFIDEMGF
jgi:hypothetical protein